MMKSLQEYMIESMVVEKFGSSKMEKLITQITPDDEFWWRIRRELMWDKISDNDVETMSPNDVLRNTKNDPDNNFYCIWVSKDDGIVGRSIGPDLFSIFANVATLLGLTRKAKIEDVYVIKNWEQFSTKDLRERRNEMKKGAIALKSNEENLKVNQRKYKKLIEILKYKNIKEATDLNELYDKITSNLNIALMALKHNESFANQYDWVTGRREIENFMKKYTDIFDQITQTKKYMKGDYQSVAFADAEWWSKKFDAKDIDDITDPWDNDDIFFRRMREAIGRLQRLHKDVDNFIKTVSDIKDELNF